MTLYYVYTSPIFNPSLNKMVSVPRTLNAKHNMHRPKENTHNDIEKINAGSWDAYPTASWLRLILYLLPWFGRWTISIVTVISVCSSFQVSMCDQGGLIDWGLPLQPLLHAVSLARPTRAFIFFFCTLRCHQYADKLAAFARQRLRNKTVNSTLCLSSRRTRQRAVPVKFSIGRQHGKRCSVSVFRVCLVRWLIYHILTHFNSND